MLTLLASLALAGQSHLHQAPPTPVIPVETKAHKDARMAWWRKSRFGLFIHWGLYAVPAGQWNGKTGYAEWIREEAHIPVKEYEGFVKQFNPVKFDAKLWAKMAHDAGMQYLVITSKHHDGFNMFDSKYTDFKITNTPWHKDPMKDLAKAVRAEGMKFCMYHSIMDWHHPDYLPRRTWEVNDRPVDGADYKRFVQYLRNDVQQILTDYAPLGVVWFDGEWENTWKEPLGSELYALCRTVDPNVIVNNRVGSGRDRELGDYSTPEQTIPATGLPGVDWETCMTMNDHWGFNKNDHDYKSVKTLVRDLVDISSKGGNFLLNIGPRADGTFPPEAINHLKGMGAWMKVNHDSIYDTTASLFDSLPWGRCTVRTNSGKSQLFLHVFDWPADGKLIVPGLGNSVRGAKILGGSKVVADRTGANVTVTLPKAHNDIDTVIELDVAGKPVVFKSPVIQTQTPGFVTSIDVPISVPAGLTVRYTVDGSPVTGTSATYSKPIHTDRPATISAVGFYNGKPVTQAVSKKLDKLSPWPMVTEVASSPGLDVDEYLGDFNSVNDFANLTPSRMLTATQVNLDPTWRVAPEHIARLYSGFLEVPASELYRFVLRSDDGSQLMIDGKVIANNDGLHSANDVAGFVPLTKGPHKIAVTWFNKTGDAALSLKWAIGSGSVQSIPATAYRH